ncbi:YadA-like family protein [Veillonella sp. oral taxon 780]|uniref:YadA-like family protein n=1 Tax=Veillonella sp. oral taxon 780 TaxID=671229 RepID=UPI00021A3101|nr:YadA-like family protein [Veillonella sp. oral taxon 780]EGS38826.1 YadA-like C-terminal domain protein [Veillonella sp. oral taxon 780 str. F0422]
MNGKSLTDKVNALRNGEAGSVVYTDDQGNRLVKANDGKYYKADQVDKDGNKIGAAKPVDSDKLQASVMNPDGKGGPTTLSNLKDGKIAENSKDAVTGNQLHAAKAEVAKYLGGGATVDENGNVTEPTFTVKDKDNKDVAAHNVGDALSTMNERLNNAHSAAAADITQLKNMEGLTEAGKNKIKELAGEGVDVKGDKNITVTSTMENGVKTFHATLSEKVTLGKHDANDPDGDHANDPGVELDGHEGTIVAGDPNGKTAVKIDGKDGSVTAGTGDKEVKLDGKDGNVTVGTGDTQVKLDGPKGTVSTGKGDKEVKMNGADGTITAGDGANGKQVKLDGKDGSVQANKVTAGKGDKAVSLDGDKGTITAGKGANAVAINGTDATIKAGTGENQVGINGKDGSVTAKTVTAKDLNANTLTLGDKNSPEAVKMDGTKGTITTGKDAKAIEVNGHEGTITLGKKDGDTKVELNAEKGSVTANVGTFGAPADANGVPKNTGSATSMDKDGFSVTSKDENGNVSKVTIKDGRVSAGDPVDDKGIPTKEGSAASMDKDGFSVATKDAKGNVSKVDIKNGGITAGAPADANGVPTKEGVNTTTINDKGLSVVSKNADGTVSKVEIKDGKITGLNGSDYNNYKKDKDGNVVKDKDGNPVVDSSVKMDGAGLNITPSTGDPTKSVSLTKDGLNNGGNRITNLAPGVADTDAVTVGQVKEVTNKLGAALEKTSQRVSEVGAHSAALAAMNPLSYDPLRKSQIMAGIGSYDGNQALALGIAHYANENFMFNAGFTMGSGKSMANIGATYRFGTGDDDNIPERYKGGPISSVYVMQDEISALKAENARKDAENAEMKAQIKMLMERMGMA